MFRKPHKYRLFSPLIVHARPPFPFTFCFLPPVNAGGTIRAVFRPVRAGNKSSPADNTPFCVLIPENLCFQRPIQRQDSPAEMLAADRERNRLRTDTGIAIIQHNAVAAVIAATFPANQGVCPFPLCWGHAVQRAVRLALQRRQLFEIVFHVCPPLCLIAALPEKVSCPISAACVLRWYANAILRREKYSFSDGHSVFKVQLIDELP